MRHRTGADPRELALPLRDASDLDPLLERIDGARVVCIGEASHGTSEYYAWRAVLTRRLVEEQGFDLVAVEGDWPDCRAVHRSVIGSPGAPEDPREALGRFDRWPTWMWANEEVADFARWLRNHNLDRPVDRRVGFHGLDVYSLWESLREVLEHLREHHPDHLDTALQAVRCFEPYAEDPQAYARATRIVPTRCELEVVDLLSGLVRRHGEPHDGAAGGDAGGAGADGEDREAAFDADQNAWAVIGAEAYYRSMMTGGPTSWNVRDTHMADTLDRLLDHHGGGGTGRPARAVVWEHNTHVGDARFTDMADAGMVNVGQLARERYGEDRVVLVGFGSHRGTVVAGRSWGARAETMTTPPARRGSIEALLHEALQGDPALFVFPEDLPGWAAERRGHRAIGVVYRPADERWGNYVDTVLGRRYDAFLWLDETTALAPLGQLGDVGELETWPYGT